MGMEAKNEALGWRPVLLLILDGWGCNETEAQQPLAAASTPHWDWLRASFPYSEAAATGPWLGLPENWPGSCEWGHFLIGTGRRGAHPYLLVEEALGEGSSFGSEEVLRFLQRAHREGRRLHLWGLASNGRVHSAERHSWALLERARQAGFSGEQVLFHAVTDGWDTPPRSAMGYLARVAAQSLVLGVGRLASLCGRAYSLGPPSVRARREDAHRLLRFGEGRLADTFSQALQTAYQQGQEDMLLAPTALLGREGYPVGHLEEGDILLCFHFQPLRAHAFLQSLAEAGVEVAFLSGWPPDYPALVLLPLEPTPLPLTAWTRAQGGRWLRWASPERQEVVARCFEGGGIPPAEEMRLLPTVEEPSLEAVRHVVEAALSALQQAWEASESQGYLLNLSVVDTLAHWGSVELVRQAAEVVDQALESLWEMVVERDGVLLITADHGHAELLGEMHRASFLRHSLQPVPLLVAARELQGRQWRMEKVALTDVAPTVAGLWGLEPPEEWEGRNLMAHLEARVLVPAWKPELPRRIGPLEVVLMGLQDEVDAFHFYHRAAEAAEAHGYPEAAALYRRLAQDEEFHRETLEALHRQLVGEPPPVMEPSAQPKGTPLPPPSLSSLEILEIALQMEKDAYDLMAQVAAFNEDPQGRQLLLQLAQQEEEHYRSLLQVYERLQRGERISTEERLH